MTPNECSVVVCDRKAIAQGLCAGHYARWRKYGDPGTTALGTYGENKDRKCKEDGCEEGVYAKWLCRKHYNIAFGYSEYTGRGRKWRVGERKWAGVKCMVNGCERDVQTAGYCTMHYTRVRTNGDPGPAQSLKAEYGTGHINQNGYREIGGRLEHQTVMEAKLGRSLRKGENVHHKNGVRDDNRPENLELWITSQPAGQRPEDLVAWAQEILALYGELVER